MNRRELLTGLATMLPASAITVDVEAPIEPGSLIAITLAGHPSMDDTARLKAAVEQLWVGTPPKNRPRVLVLLEGCTLQVHRGVATVDLPKR
jgi:hypothetical protein